MSNVFTLDDIRAAADKQYGSLVIPLGDDSQLVLRNALRLPKEKRNALVKKQEEFDTKDGEKEVDQEQVIVDLLKLVAEDPKKVTQLIEELGDDLAYLAVIFERYTGATDLGEASGSQN